MVGPETITGVIMVGDTGTTADIIMATEIATITTAPIMVTAIVITIHSDIDTTTDIIIAGIPITTGHVCISIFNSDDPIKSLLQTKNTPIGN
jgi:hypothetical protein